MSLNYFQFEKVIVSGELFRTPLGWGGPGDLASQGRDRVQPWGCIMAAFLEEEIVELSLWDL